MTTRFVNFVASRNANSDPKRSMKMEYKDECDQIFSILYQQLLFRVPKERVHTWKCWAFITKSQILGLPNVLVMLKVVLPWNRVVTALKRKEKHLVSKANYYVPFVLNSCSNEKILFQTYNQFFPKVKF